MENLQHTETDKAVELLQKSITSLERKYEEFSKLDEILRAKMVFAGYGNRPDLDEQYRNNKELLRVISEQISQKQLLLEEEYRKLN